MSTIPKHNPADGDDAAELAARWSRVDATGVSPVAAFLTSLETARAPDGTARCPLEDLRHAPLSGADLRSVDFSRCDLRHADLRQTRLQHANFGWANLEEANLSHAALEAVVFVGANLSRAVLGECNGARAEFGSANLSGASLMNGTFPDAGFAEANLADADLRAADLTGVSFRHSNLHGASLKRANLTRADLKQAIVSRADFESANLQGARLLGIQKFETASWVGVDLRDTNFTGAYMARRHILDANYLFEFRSRGAFHLWLYRFWWLTSDCGRSLLRWATFVVVVTLLFAAVYDIVDIDFGEHPTPFSPVYFSVVTLTTLGYGDVVPASFAAQCLVVSQAVLGYVGLGGLLAILSNKMARRAE